MPLVEYKEWINKLIYWTNFQVIMYTLWKLIDWQDEIIQFTIFKGKKSFHAVEEQKTSGVVYILNLYFVHFIVNMYTYLYNVKYVRYINFI